MSYPTPQNNQPSGESALPVLALVFAFLFPIVGAIIGHVALGQMKKGQILDTNKSLATAGVILGWVFTGLWLLLSVITFVVLYLPLLLMIQEVDLSGY